MDGLQGQGHLADDVNHPRLGHSGLELTAQVAPLEVLHGNVGMVIGETLVMDAHHMGVDDLGEQRVLLDEARQLA